ASLYHGLVRVDPALESLTVTAQSPVQPNVMVAMADQPATDSHPARRIVHLVNHEYDGSRTDASGINPLSNVTVTIPVASNVTGVVVASPDYQDSTVDMAVQ